MSRQQGYQYRHTVSFMLLVLLLASFYVATASNIHAALYNKAHQHGEAKHHKAQGNSKKNHHNHHQRVAKVHRIVRDEMSAEESSE